MQDESLEAKKKAMSLLKYMDRTEWQLRDKLSLKGFSEEAIEEAIEYVKSFHYLDDYRYAVHFLSASSAETPFLIISIIFPRWTNS